MFAKISTKIVRHKFASSILVLAVLPGGYFFYHKFTASGGATQYVTAMAEKGTLVVSVTGSGQVSNLNQADIKPKASGDVIALYVKPGQNVKKGSLLVQIDTTDAERSVRDAKTSLETAKLDLDKFLQPADLLTLLQSENSLIQTQESKQKAEDTLKKDYEDGFNTVANAFLSLPAVMGGLHDVLFLSDKNLGGQGGQWNIDFYASAAQNYDARALQYKDNARKTYQTAREQYDQTFSDYKNASRFSDTATIEKLIDGTYDMTRGMAEAVKSANNLIQFYEDTLRERGFIPQSVADTHLSSLNSYTGTINNHVTGLLSAKQSLKDSKDSIVSAERSIEEKTLSVAKTKSAPDDLDIRAKKITIQQKEDALLAAEQVLADHFIRAPFDGIIAKVSVKKGDSVSSGTAVATLITRQKLAEISLNEVDIAKIKTGQKATITFDALENFSLTGEVTEVDTIGAVTQGVVTYSVKIGFDTQDERIKPSMSLSTAIIMDVKQDVLLVPNSAIKQQGDMAYVEIIDGNISSVSSANVSTVAPALPPRRQSVTTGLFNDEMTEVTTGLKEGDKVVTQTITPIASASQSTTQQNTGLRIPGITSGGGGGGFQGGGRGLGR